MVKIKLAEALLRRKELAERVDRLRRVKDSTFCEPVLRRVSVAEGYDQITGTVPKFGIAELDKEFNRSARALRMVDAVVQQANWTTEVEIEEEWLSDN